MSSNSGNDASEEYVRLQFVTDGEMLIILFGGGTKRRQEADIERAKELHAEYKARKAAGIKPRESKGPRKQR